jgi:hypothetical protein
MVLPVGSHVWRLPKMGDDPRRPEAGEYHDSREGNRQKQAAEGDGFPPTTPPVEEEHTEGVRQNPSGKADWRFAAIIVIAIFLVMTVMYGAYLLLIAFGRELREVIFM